MKPGRALALRRETLARLDTDECRQVGGQAEVTPLCTPVILTIPVTRCLSHVLADCPLAPPA